MGYVLGTAAPKRVTIAPHHTDVRVQSGEFKRLFILENVATPVNVAITYWLGGSTNPEWGPYNFTLTSFNTEVTVGGLQKWKIESDGSVWATDTRASGIVIVNEHFSVTYNRAQAIAKNFVPFTSGPHAGKKLVAIESNGKALTLAINQTTANRGYDKPSGYADSIRVGSKTLHLTRQVMWAVTRMSTYSGFNRWLIGTASGNMGATGSSWFPPSHHMGTNQDCGGRTSGGTAVAGQSANYDWHDFHDGTHTNASWFDDALAQNIAKYGFATTMSLHYMGSIFNNVTMAMDFSTLAFRWVYK